MDLINLNKGEKVIYNDKEVIITRLNTVDSVTIEEISTGINHLVHVSDLKPIFKKKDKNLWNKISDNRKILLQFILTNLFYFLKGQTSISPFLKSSKTCSFGKEPYCPNKATICSSV